MKIEIDLKRFAGLVQFAPLETGGRGLGGVGESRNYNKSEEVLVGAKGCQ